MNMLGHISNTLSNHPTPFPFEDTNYDYTIHGVLSKIEKMLLGGFDLETIRKKEKRGYWYVTYETYQRTPTHTRNFDVSIPRTIG